VTEVARRNCARPKKGEIEIVNYVSKALELAGECKFRDCPSVQDWENLEKDLGIKLPEAYKQFVSSFGSGYFGSDIYLYNPHPQGSPRLDRGFLEEFPSLYHLLLSDLESGYWRKLFPEKKDGLICAALTASRHCILVDPLGPKRQTVFLNLGQMYQVELAMSLPEFLCRLYLNNLDLRDDLKDFLKDFRDAQWDENRPFFTPQAPRQKC
jgi:hypothetical protein